jgi:hypothetical protein
VAAYRAEKYDEASERLEKAYRLMPVPSLALWSARALVARGLWTRAAERYLSARRLALGPGDPQIQLSAQRRALEERAALVPRIPTLRVLLAGAEAAEVRISVDGSALPALLVAEHWPVDPGTHGVVGVRGEEQVEATSSVKEGEHAEVVLHFAERSSEVAPSVAPSDVALEPASARGPAANEPLTAGSTGAEPRAIVRDTQATPWRSVGWVSLGVGSAALLTSGALGLAAQGRREELAKSGDCAGGACLERQRGDVESYNRLVDFSTVGWIGGAALAGGGLLLVLSVPGSEGAAHVAVGPNAVGLSGQF